MIALQFHGKIWYRTYKDVEAGVELLVWYGEQYAKELGIALQNDVSDDQADGKWEYWSGLMDFSLHGFGCILLAPNFKNWKLRK